MLHRDDVIGPHDAPTDHKSSMKHQPPLMEPQLILISNQLPHFLPSFSSLARLRATGAQVDRLIAARAAVYLALCAALLVQQTAAVQY